VKNRRTLAGAGALLIVWAFLVAGQAADVSQVHLGWSRDDVYTTMTVVWHSTVSAPGRVVYDTSSHATVAGYAFAASATAGVVRPAKSTDGSTMTVTGFSGSYQKAELTGLTPGTVYFFRVLDSAGASSSEWSFRTIARSQEIRFVFGGDSQRPFETGAGECGQLLSRPTAPANWPYMRNFLMSKAAEEDPDFVLILGDFVARGNNQSQWADWFDAWQERAVTQSGRMVPLVPVIGNHDVGSYPKVDSSYEWFLGMMAVPQPAPGHPFYSLDFPGLRLTILSATARHTEGDSGDAYAEASAQRNWLRSSLASADTKWKIVAFHYNYLGCYAACTGYPSDQYMELWSPLFQGYDVDMVLMGHTHNYTRTWPVTLPMSDVCGGSTGFDATLNEDSEDGVTYVVHGGWGAPANPIVMGTGCIVRDWIAAAASHPSIGIADVSSSTLTVKVRDTANALLDSFQLPFVTPTFPVPGYTEVIP